MRVLNGYFLLKEDFLGPVVAGCAEAQKTDGRHRAWRPLGMWVCTAGASSVRATTRTVLRN